MSGIDSQISESLSSEGDFDIEQDEDEDALDYYFTEDSVEPSVADTDPEWYAFQCINYKEVWPFVSEQVASLRSNLNINLSSSLALLQSNNWKQESTIQKYKEDRNRLLKEARVFPSSTNSMTVDQSVCLVCSCELQPNDFNLLSDCRHCFCHSCWLAYLSIQVKDGRSLGIECMTCDALVSTETVEELLKPYSDIYTNYSYHKITDIVLSHHLLRWCPGVDCDIVFIVDEPSAKRVTCSSCDLSICFLCGEEYHSPTECGHFKNWLVKCQDDSETFNYISANTKDCPKCGTSIEKNGGCNHIRCSCSHDFCWMCLEDWSKHNGEYYECSRYKADPSKYKDKAGKERCALQKYLFYYERWKNHNQSLMLEEETRKRIQSHIESKVAGSEGTWIDWQYLMDAASLLKKCRYTLKYTYPRAYWMEGDKKQLFEYQQAQLELEIENLSWKVERANITDRPDLEQQMAVTEVRRTTLLRDFTV